MDILTYTDLDRKNKADGTYRRRPPELYDARIAADMAWKSYDATLEYELYGAEYEMRDTDHGKIDDARGAAEAAEQWYSDLYDRWQAGEL